MSLLFCFERLQGPTWSITTLPLLPLCSLCTLLPRPRMPRRRGQNETNNYSPWCTARKISYSQKDPLLRVTSSYNTENGNTVSGNKVPQTSRKSRAPQCPLEAILLRASERSEKQPPSTGGKWLVEWICGHSCFYVWHTETDWGRCFETWHYKGSQKFTVVKAMDLKPQSKLVLLACSNVLPAAESWQNKKQSEHRSLPHKRQ